MSNISKSEYDFENPPKRVFYGIYKSDKSIGYTYNGEFSKNLFLAKYNKIQEEGIFSATYFPR